MTYIIKRKLQAALGDNADNADMSVLIQHIQSGTDGLIIDQDTLIVNHLIVKKTMKIPVGTDKYR